MFLYFVLALERHFKDFQATFDVYLWNFAKSGKWFNTRQSDRHQNTFLWNKRMILRMTSTKNMLLQQILSKIGVLKKAEE